MDPEFDDFSGDELDETKGLIDNKDWEGPMG
jgi:hypothetical protein